MQSQSMMGKLDNPIVHIGLGKTATTSLQSFVFPAVSEFKPSVRYNDEMLLKRLRNRRLMTSIEEKDFQMSVCTGNHFISMESLVDWNPRNWEFEADRNLRLFSRDATIILTVRTTEDYLRSVFQQMVHEGNVWSPKEFFVSGEEYERLKPFIATAFLTKFDVDSFDLEYLLQLYVERFSNVFVVPLTKIKELEFLKEIFGLDEIEMDALKRKFHAGRLLNRSYSKRAMKLTMWRENLLRHMGLSSFGSQVCVINIHQSSTVAPKGRVAFRKLKVREQLVNLIPRLFARITSALKWRHFLQCWLDKLLPYEPYVLPIDVYRNESLAYRNDNLIAKLELRSGRFTGTGIH